MCKSKKMISRAVIPPSAKTKNPPPPFDPSTSGQIMSSSASTSSFYVNFNKDSQSWKSSRSSGRNSLSSLREALPEQPRIYDFPEIRSATQNFLQPPLSSSSTATSWRCVVRGQTVVVIQRKFRRLLETPELVERVAMICRSHHSSLIPLKGVAVSGNYIYLVYEYIHGANLRDALRNPRNPNFTILSNWMLRVQIVSDIASGLDYIHNSTGLGFDFVHNHIKSSSIIVTDPPLGAKICHFGTAELCGEIAKRNSESDVDVESNRKEMKFEGTRGYMAPEFQSTGAVSQKSDVYAFGVVVLEVASGTEALKYVVDEETGGYARISVVETAREAFDGGRIRQWVDPRLRDSYPVDVAVKLVRLALECLDDNPNVRPDTGQIAVRVSQMFLESQIWANKIGLPTDITLSLGPR
ncbi:unnamed protein product [Cuscuta campestris]|uniref:Protein kinase domain-containing protein n=2 Tax=Cuscuta sect. Cleistogrammica TaxID=1824901 RepID=A0A484KNR3_9ASTE|nr:hypothetical protein DM860_009243 [Cuscuta australis]VFQ64799.1 unnamed protein product [Cuscuta campestris]